MSSRETLHVTFVCTGNICRSVMAEKMFADQLRRRGLAVDQLQVGPGQRGLGQHPDLFGVDRIDLLHTVSHEGILVHRGGLGVTQPRRDGHRLRRRAGDGRDVGPLQGPHVAAVDQDGRSAVDDERRQHLERRLRIDHPQSGQHLHVRQIVTGCGDLAPLRAWSR